MNAQNLKNSILQLAIQGKLVEQREAEGTAKELIEKIQAEKKQLIKEGKIKKQKELPGIKEDEIPFDIPESWEWVRLIDIGITQTGNTPSKTKMEYFGKFIPFISVVVLCFYLCSCIFSAISIFLINPAVHSIQKYGNPDGSYHDLLYFCLSDTRL